MKRKMFDTLNRIARIVFLSGCLSTLLSGSLNAQSVAQDVLDDIVISKSGFTGIVKIKFRVPLRYISHNPKKIGKEIRIRVAVVNNNNVRRNLNNQGNTANQGGNFGGGNPGFNTGTDDEFRANLRESLVPRQKFSFGLEEVSYETVLRENYLTLYFENNVSFEIIQDASYRSISVIIHDVKE
ncbi:hypothetical protein MNBD_GAMMA10-2208 [hydrothermal vent metagenome]|uniref:Uncharacterized protein n=1 Tax=hydrothermal vent metagenome TaxID=652676 RepID=A0A3B0XZK0_9ZZZZ